MKPPRIAIWLLELTTPPQYREGMLGDLEEEYLDRVQTDGARVARRWFWSQILRSIPGSLVTHRRAPRTHSGGVGTMTNDLRAALRLLVRQPVFALVVILTLGLGIGANTVVFSVVHGTILDPFPFPEPDRVVGVGTEYLRQGVPLSFFENASPAEFLDIVAGVPSLEDVVAFDLGNRQIDGEGEAQNVFTAFWWGDPLRTVGMEPHLGRSFTQDEIDAGSRVAMITHRSWTNRFGADSTMVGGPLSINGEVYTLVGIVPEGVLFYGADLWTIMPVSPDVFPRNRRQFEIIGRIAEGATLEQTNVELERLARRVEQDHGAEFEEYVGWRAEARTWTDINVSTLKLAGVTLMGAVGFLLLLVCSNVANLLLARGAGRRSELAVRRALGAGREQILRLLLMEAALLAVLGGALRYAPFVPKSVDPRRKIHPHANQWAERPRKKRKSPSRTAVGCSTVRRRHPFADRKM